METKQSTITKVTANGIWKSDKGNFYKWEVEFQNGDAGGAMTKELEQKRYVVGETITYTKEVKGNFTNIKRQDEKPAFNGGFKSNFNPEADAKKQIMIILQSSLKEALQFHTINGYPKGSTDIGENLKTTWNTAEWFAKKILQSNLLNPATAEPAKNGSDARNSAKSFVEQSESPF